MSLLSKITFTIAQFISLKNTELRKYYGGRYEGYFDMALSNYSGFLGDENLAVGSYYSLVLFHNYSNLKFGIPSFVKWFRIWNTLLYSTRRQNGTFSWGKPAKLFQTTVYVGSNVRIHWGVCKVRGHIPTVPCDCFWEEPRDSNPVNSPNHEFLCPRKPCQWTLFVTITLPVMLEPVSDLPDSRQIGRATGVVSLSTIIRCILVLHRR